MKHHSTRKAVNRYKAAFCRLERVAIPVAIETEQDFFDARDRLAVTLAPKISSYLDACLVDLPKHRPVTVIFCAPELSRTRKEAVCNLLKTHYALRICAVGRNVAMLLLQAAGAGLAIGLMSLFIAAVTACAMEILYATGIAVAAGIIYMTVGRLAPLLETVCAAKRLFAASVEFQPLSFPFAKQA